MAKKKEVGSASSKKTKKEHPWVKYVIWLLAFCALAGMVSVGALFAHYAKDLPNPEKINKRVVAESTKIFDRTGEVLLYEIHGEEKRTIIPFDEIPDTVKYATIVLEDSLFYSHHGFDVGGLFKAVCHETSSRVGLGDLMGICPQRGGSTITQQFIKNSILTSERRYSRKIKELILAIEMEQKFTKDEILQMYLNEIPYGSNAYGIEAASQTFFGVNAKDLTLAQAALLAGLPNAPTYFSPTGTHTDRLLVRWKYALDQMADRGYITKEQAESAKSEDILSQIKPVRDDIKAPHFVLYIKDKLVEEFGEDAIEKGGFQVYTTLDWDLQQLAERAVREGVDENGEKYKFSNAALVSVNPKNGDVLAMVGSKDYFDESIDGNVNVSIRLRQPGSSFKPYVYAKAFEKGYKPETILFDVVTDFATREGEDYIPLNYDLRERGPVQMKQALASSLNIPAVKALYLAGINDTIDMVEDMGIKTLTDPDRYGLSLVLGGGEVKLLEHTGAFGVFANDGIKYKQRVFLKIEDSNGNIVKSFDKTKGEQVIDKKIANQIASILSDDTLRMQTFGPKSDLYVEGHHVAAKTGTTNEYRDGWLVGSVPSLAAGVWAGNNDNAAMSQGAAGIYVAGPIWNKFMTEALKNYRDEEFKVEEEEEVKPDEENSEGEEVIRKPILDGTLEIIEKVNACEYDKDEWCLYNDECPSDKKEKKKFFTAHTILYYVDKDNPLGDYPDHPEDDEQFRNWEEAVLRWGEEKADGKGRDVLPTKECKEKYFD